MSNEKKVDAKIKKLKEKAFALLASEKYKDAVDVYVKLNGLDPTEGEWARRAADCHWHLKNPDQRLKYSLIAARAYSETGLVLKAIAMCKVVLSIDPTHKETQERLARFHSLRPKAPRRPQPAGVRRLAPPPAVTDDGQARVPLPGRRHSLRPTTKEGEDRKVEKTRARMAAAAALRQARAQMRREAVATSRLRREEDHSAVPPKTHLAAEAVVPPRILAPDAKPIPREDPESSGPPPPNKGDSAEQILGKVELKPMIVEPNVHTSGVNGPPSSAFPSLPHPEIPSLRLGPPRDSRPAPPLDLMRLSERVPARTIDSLPPARGNIYSLTLDQISGSELRAARIPNIAAPSEEAQQDIERVAVIDPVSDRPTLVPSIAPGNPGLYEGLAEDRASFAQRNFASIPLLSELDPDVLRQLITDVAMVELKTNEVLFSEGDMADAMYVVVEGSVTAVTLPHGEKPIVLAHLEEGDFFGEIGLMSDQPRQATVSAHEPCRLLRFDRDIVAILVDQDPAFLATLLQFLKDRLVEDLMMSSPLFSPFSEDERYALADQFEFLEIDPQSVLLATGQHPIGMYVLLTGEALLKGASDAGTVRRLGPGDIFGEQALLNNKPSAIEVKTATKCFALCLPSDAFPEVIMTHPTVLAYLSTLNESSKGELDVAEDFLDHITFF